MKKSKNSIIIAVVITMLLQIVIPVSFVSYADRITESFRITDTKVEGTSGSISWEFDYDTSSNITKYQSKVDLILEKEQSGEIKTYDDTIIGNYKISEDGKMTFDIDENLEELITNDSDVESPVPITTTSAITGLPIEDIEETITYTFKGSIEINGVIDESEQLLSLLNEGKNLGNIFEAPHVTVNDEPLSNGSIIEITDDMVVKIHYDWKLSNDIDLAADDYAITKLPDVLSVVNPTGVGELYDEHNIEVGSYVFEDGNLKVVFNHELVGKEERKGDVWFLAEFDLEKFEENVIQKIEFEEIFEPITIKVKPKNSLGILNKKVSLNASINATEIYWEIDVNSSLDNLKNATLEDIIPNGLNLVTNSIKVYNLEVGYEGKVTQGSITNIEGVVTSTGLKVEFGEIDTAYRIKYTTTINDYSKSPFVNNAVLTDESIKKAETSASVSVVVGSSIEKSGRADKSGNDSTKITWTIDINKSESKIIGAVVKDVISDPRLTINNNSIKVYYLNKSGSNWTQGSLVDGIITTGFPITIGDTNGRAYRIVFDTNINYGDTYEPKITFENTATLTGKNINDSTKSAQVVVNRSTLLAKDGVDATNYDAPNFKWTIHVNRAGQNLNNAVVTDTMDSGLRFREGTLKIFDNTTLIDTTKYAEKGITVNTSSNPMTFKLGNISSYYKIEYVTDIEVLDKEGGYKNNVKLTADYGLGGVGNGYTDISKTIKPTVTNKYTKSTVNTTIDQINYNGIDYSAKTMSWNIRIQPIEEKITSLTITDTFTNNGLVFLPDTLKVIKGTGSNKVTLNSSTDYKVTPTNSGQNGFVLVFNASALPLQGSEYNIYFKTSFDPDEVTIKNTTKDYINKATFTGTTVDKGGKSNPISTSSNASYTVSNESFDAGSKQGTLNRDNRTITWKVFVNYMSQDFINIPFIIEDVLNEPEQKLDYDSIVVKEFSVNSNGTKNVSNTAIDSSLYKLEPKVVDGKEGFVLTFENGIDKPYVIEFNTKITGISNQYYNNVATVKVAETTIKHPATTKEEYSNYNNFIEKSASNVIGNQVYTDDIINWEVPINKSTSEIKDVIFTDSISSGLVYVNESLKVVDKDNKEVPKEIFSLDVELKQDGTTVLTVNLGDINSLYTITYDTVVVATSGFVSNKASIKGANLVEKTIDSVRLSSTKSSGGTGSGVNRGNIKIVKVDSEGSPIALSAKFEFYYLLNGNIQIVGGEQVTTNNSGIYEFKGLPFRTYYLREVEPPLGYEGITDTIEIALPDADNNKDIEVTVTNTKIKVDVTGTKKWVNGPIQKPDIELQLYRNDEVYEEPVTLQSGKLEYTWKSLDKTDDNGIDYIYTIKEVGVPENYVKLEEGLTVTNTYVSPKTSITGTKNWVGGPTLRPDIKLQLYRDGIAYREPITLKSGTTYTWENLDKKDLTGKDYVYTIDELEVPENYGKSVSQDGLTIKNIYESPKTDIIGRKEWINGELNRPDSIKLQLYRASVSVPKEPVGDPIVLSNGIYEYNWKDQYINDNNGSPYTYTIEEIETPENYVKSEEGLTVTNTYVIPKTSVTGTKIWVGGSNSRPTIQLQLYRDGEVYEDPVTLENGTTTHTWSEIDKTDINGREYVYTIDEVEVPRRYIKSISEDGLTVTNKYNPPSKPSDPKEPEVPEEPETPEEPEQPEEPVEPETPIKYGNILINKRDLDSNPIQGAEFTLYDENGTAVRTVTSNENGEVLFSNIPLGVYAVVETKAAEGYVLLNDELIVSLDEVKTLKYTFTNAPEGIEIIDPDVPLGWDPIEDSDVPKGELPDTGKIFGTFTLILSGAGLILSGIGILIKKRFAN